jgi:hypothetical protein
MLRLFVMLMLFADFFLVFLLSLISKVILVVIMALKI